MIKFKDNAFVAGQYYRAGMMAEFDAPTEAQLIAAGDADTYAVVSTPVEIIASDAVSVPCASTLADEILATYKIAAGTLGVNSGLQIEPLWTFTSSANNKILKVKIGVVTIYSATRTTSAKEAPFIVLANRNSLASQIQPYDNGYVTAGTGTPATYTIDFSKDVTITITGQRANAGDSLALEYYRILHFFGD